MKINRKALCYLVFVSMLYCASWGWCGIDNRSGNDWDSIWLLPMPEPTTVETGKLSDLGEELENRQWQMVATKYHQIHYQPSTDKRKVAEIYARIDNIYRFLAERSPAKPQIPIRVFIVPDEFGHSRCSKISNAMRTGDKGDALFMLTSLLHEETHVFNFAFLNSMQQGWWAGEFCCIYFQQRALWHGQGKQVKQQIKSLLPDGPRCHLSEISNRGKLAFDEAISVLYFFEERYGREKLIALRKAFLAESKRTNGRSLSNSVFEEVSGKGVEQLEKQWMTLYGWESLSKLKDREMKDGRLKKRISYSVDKASVQDIVIEMARRADLNYDWTKSQSNAGQLCKRWIYNVRVQNQPLDDAIKEILNPVGLTYRLEGNKIVLYKK